MTEPCDLSATAARDLIGSGALSPVALLESCVRRMESVNGSVNAVVATCLERARAEAQAAEAAVRSGDALGPLHGLPVGIKDLNATEGLVTTYGSLPLADNVPDADEALVAGLRRAGAIVVGKTNTPEFGAGTNTTNKVYGPTRNPFDLERTSGGSSGGSAAALACGMLPLCQGGDTGGSLRNPATWCGVVGFRSTPGLVPRETRALNYTHFNVQGPMARNVRDVALMMAALAADDSRDPLSGPVDAMSFAQLKPVDLGGLRVAWSTDFGGAAPIDDDIRRLFADVMQRIAPAFGWCEVRDPNFEHARDAFWTLRCVNYLANHTERYEKNCDVLSPNIIANVEAGQAMSLADVSLAERQWRKIYLDFQAFFADVDLLIVPGNATPPFRIEEGIPKEINGRKMENYMDASLIRSALTLTGHPVIAVPCGVDHLGMPFGFQVVAARRADKFLLEAAAALEDHLQGIAGLSRSVPNLEALSS